MALNPPFDVDFVVDSPYGGNLKWDNGGEYMLIELWQNKAATFWEIKDYLSGSRKERYIDNLDANTNYCFKLKGIGPPPGEEDSGFSDPPACGDTYALLQDPSDIETTVFSDFIEITWKDNSADEDAFCIERNDGGWHEIAVVAANVEFWRDTTVAVGVAYTYRVRARQDPSNYSDDYTTGVEVTANNVPNNPTGADISEVTDEELRVTWVAPAAGFEVTGYKVQISTTGAFGGEEDEYIVADDVLTFFFKGLTPGQTYWIRVYAYNGVGDSAGFSANNDTCLVARVRTEFEVFVRDPEIEPVYIAEIDLKMDLSGFEPTAGEAPVYDVEIDERGLEIDSVWEDGEALIEKASIAQVKALAGSWWWDTSIRKLYVRSSTDADPDDFFMEGGFTHLIPSKNFTYADTVGCTLPPWLSASNVPGVTQEIKSYYEGNFRLSSGSISFINALSDGEYYFDKRFEKFTWIGARLGIYVGKETFNSLTKFKKMFTAYISDKSIEDRKITFSLGDVREGLERNLVLDTYSQAEYPGMEEDFEGEEKLKAWGYITDVPPVPIGAYDVDEKASAKFHFHDGRSWSVTRVTLNDVEKAEGTDYATPGDYYIDLRRSIITFDRDLEISPDDIVLVTFTGRVNSANEPFGTYNPGPPEYVSGPAEVFKNVLNVEGTLLTAELNTDWIYETKYANKKSVSVPLYKDTNFNEIIKTIEHSSEAYVIQDGEGKIGLRPLQAVVPSRAKYIWNFQSKGHGHRKGRDSLYWKVKVYYAESVEIQGKWAVAEAVAPNIRLKFGVQKELSVYCYFESETTAQVLATAILALLNKTYIEDELPMILFDVFPGDLVPFSRTRFFDSSGTASEVALRILRTEKNPQTGKTSVKMEKV